MGIDLRSPTITKLFRYSAASVVAVSVGQPVLWLCYGVFGWGDLTSNLVSVSCGAVPNYLINRHWTWHQSGKNRLWGEIVPFWSMAILGAILSMLAVAYADRTWGGTLAVSLTNVASTGSTGGVWRGSGLLRPP